jgi:predicted phosphohydrolase
MNDPITVVGVINKIKYIADTKYEGKVYDNIMPIFNKLNTDEKRVLLKGLMNICFIFEDKFVVETQAIEEVKVLVKENKDTIENEIENIEQFNQRELIRLKTWLVKTVVKSIIGSFVLFSLGLIMFGNDDNAISKLLKNVFDLFKVIFSG